MPELRRQRPVNLWGLVVNQPNLMLPKDEGDPVSNKQTNPKWIMYKKQYPWLTSGWCIRNNTHG